jgi:cell division transport system permease protein
MFARLGYFARETWVSLRRNTLMTAAGVITVGVSLCVLGGSLLLTRLVDHGTQKWKDGVQFEIFMRPDAPVSQVEGVQKALDGDAQVDHYKYLSHDDAYEEFKRLSGADQPDLLRTVRPADLPESFRVAPTKAELTKTVSDRYTALAGVDEVNTADKQVKRLLDLSRWVRRAFLAIFGALLFASLFLIVNTIRLATFARRREIEVMKLVGASNWFVRTPFMMEGMVQGVVGAGFGIAVVFGLQRILSDAIPQDDSLWQGWYVASGDAWSISIIVLLIGATIGVFGALVGLRRFLDV